MIDTDLMEVHYRPQLRALRARVRKTLRPRKDNIRYYYRCAGCQAKAEKSRNEALTPISFAIMVSHPPRS